MPILNIQPRNAGDNKFIEKEKFLKEIKFNKYKISKKDRPDPQKVLIITNFSEFGCEALGLMYCIPRILQQFSRHYIICVGWYGREFLYRHLVDEYWEIDEQYQFLREYCNAFAHTSKNLSNLEKSLEQYGTVFRGYLFGYFCVFYACNKCKHMWNYEEHTGTCVNCGSNEYTSPILYDISHYKRLAVKIPRPSKKCLDLAKKYLKPNAVGIFARGRKTYGRNLPEDFYIKLINLLEGLGFNPIWLGEKQSVLPCPVNHIVDFSRLPESQNLELTLAICAQLEFTVQFWTASTRLASMVDTPWLLFETPEQIAGIGQEGRRIDLVTDYNKRKLVLSNYHTVMENQESALDIVKKSIFEMQNDNWSDMIGLVEDANVVKAMMTKQENWRIS